MTCALGVVSYLLTPLSLRTHFLLFCFAISFFRSFVGHRFSFH